MLSTQAITTAAAQVASFESRGMIVRPMDGSVLDMVVKACHVPVSETTMIEADGSHRLYLDILENFANSSDKITGACEHTLTQEELSVMLAEKVTGFLAHARTVAAPMVERYAAALHRQAAEITSTIPHDFDITVYSLPAPLGDTSILNSVKKAEHVVIEKMDLPAMAIDTMPVLAEVIKTGSSSTDAAIASWLSLKPANYLDKVWEQVFSSTTNRTVAADAFFYDNNDGNDNLLAVFLLCRGLLDNPPEGTTMSLQAYNAAVHELRMQVASRINARIEIAERNERNGVLVMNQFNRQITVNLPVYTKWLKSGGTNEILFGNALSGSSELMADKIDARRDEFARKWEQLKAVSEVNFRNRIFVRLREMADVEFTKLLGESTHEEIPLNEREVIAAKFTEQLNCTREEEMSDINCWALRLIAKSVFWRKDAFRILNDICEIRTSNPNLEPNQAAAIAAINYISYWVSKQMVLDRP